MLTPEVAEAIAELKQVFPDREMTAEEDGHGGAYVIVPDLDLGPQYQPARSWIGFQISYQYPLADVYPHFTDPSLARADGQPLGAGFGTVHWRERQVTQISRRSNRWEPAVDTAAAKLAKVLQWLSER